jgi:hypothetical protein
MPHRVSASRWWPTSKMTGVGVSGVLYVWGVFMLETFYGVELEPWVVAANQAWILFLVGYSITELRGTQWSDAIRDQ